MPAVDLTTTPTAQDWLTCEEHELWAAIDSADLGAGPTRVIEVRLTHRAPERTLGSPVALHG